MEWQVGQWVECSELGGMVGQVEGIIGPAVSIRFTTSQRYTTRKDDPLIKPFVWQVGKRYKTTLEGVTATIEGFDTEGDLVGPASNDPDDDVWAWSPTTGLLRNLESDQTAPHLLPFLADESSDEPTLTERYTVEHDGGPWWLLRDNQRGKVLPFATRELAEHALELAKSGEGLLGWKAEDDQERDGSAQPDPINPQHYRDHPSGVECIEIVEHMGYSIGTAMAYLWRAGKKGPAIEDLKKAKWFISREIKRLSKGGAE